MVEKKIKKIINKYNNELKDWSFYNYKYVGSEWLIKALEPLCREYEIMTFLSPSANKGYSEEEAFIYLSRNHKCILNFILSDLCGETLYRNKSDIYIGCNCLNYRRGQWDAGQLGYNREIDVILDQKGALWTILNDGSLQKKKIEVLKLLKSYVSYLRDNNSILFFDCYQEKRFHFLMILRNTFRYRIFKGNIMKDRFHDFEEKSTFHYFKKTFKRNSDILQCIKLMEPVRIKNGNQYMKLAKVSRENLIRIIKTIEEEISK